MEHYKTQAAKRMLTFDQIKQFQFLVIEKLMESAPKIRCCYNSYLDLDDESLAWIMAIDALFLLDFLMNFEKPSSVYSKKREGEIIRDIMILENQIPMEVMMIIWTILNLGSEVDLGTLLISFCRTESPLNSKGIPPYFTSASSATHLLHLMCKIQTHRAQIDESKKVKYSVASIGISASKKASKTKLIAAAGETSENLITIAAKGNIPGAGQFENYLNMLKGISGLIEGSSPTTATIEEIQVPSASQLSEVAKLEFQTCQVISDMELNLEGPILRLPPLTLNVNSEVILRNLVAYEVCREESLEIAGLVDLISGLIDTAEDAKVLKDVGIICAEKMSDDEIARLFNGFNRSNTEDGQSKIDKIATQLNAEYEKKLRVRAYNWLKKYVYDSWRFLTVIASILMLVMLIVQSVCTVFGCSRFFSSK